MADHDKWIDDAPKGEPEDAGQRLMTRRELAELERLRKMQTDYHKRGEQLDMLKQQMDILERSVARADPSLLVRTHATKRDEYGDDLPDRVLALAHTGMHVTEIAVELGLTEEKWRKWAKEHPAFRDAARRAPGMACARYTRMARFAMEQKDYKFPMAMVKKFQDALMDGWGGEDSRGNAADLVRIDGTLTE